MTWLCGWCVSFVTRYPNAKSATGEPVTAAAAVTIKDGTAVCSRHALQPGQSCPPAADT